MIIIKIILYKSHTLMMNDFPSTGTRLVALILEHIYTTRVTDALLANMVLDTSSCIAMNGILKFLSQIDK